ncbi:TPA: helix-turn-helix domain-containing protein [Salmonella enterica]|uniref:Helix-turn-helix domain-containing protein n=1 Tax=Salmonella enterica TaxID=28901 RepID=A0A757XQE1_SALER|nr:helix-turn-helix domain-containing protein [Salmonella enterica subsp. enterica serovar Typhimurium]EBL7509099.1 helix-turn-helix domain-containing protein [Salmonella enterica]EBS5057535.1 XRE family transcriptional regulator [Salmonella enterica subsp. enterica serovar Stanley]ECB7885878.1 helix-turn-helix domain-containing protein [Salmonella enterica subsp. enterica serovar Gaminara]ECF0055951.1 helix-turn-helix domain-containing protein [Salmonella enterica subsp. enterica serovar Coeln
MMTALEVSMYRISRLLSETGWSQAELARRIGVTQQTVQQWVSGRATPKPASLDKLVEVTGHPLYWFMLPPEEGDQVAVPDTIKIGPRQKELLQTFEAFPEQDQELMLQEMKEKKESMERTVARWLAAQKGRRA